MNAIVLFTLGICISLYFTYDLLSAFRKTKPPKGWPVAEGRMLMLRGNEALLPSRLDHIPEIMFTFLYEVNGVQYTGTWYGPIPRLKDKLLKGEDLDVYYNPENPAFAILQGKVLRSVIALDLAMITVGLAIATGGFFA
jgi:hypothetical protein